MAMLASWLANLTLGESPKSIFSQCTFEYGPASLHRKGEAEKQQCCLLFWPRLEFFQTCPFSLSKLF